MIMSRNEPVPETNGNRGAPRPAVAKEIRDLEQRIEQSAAWIAPLRREMGRVLVGQRLLIDEINRAPTTVKSALTTSKSADDRPGARRACIAVAADDAAMLDIIASTLRDDGCDVVEIGSGAVLLSLTTLVDILRASTANLFILDLRATSVAALDALRAARCMTPAILLMSAFARDDVKARASSLGARVLEKPFTMDELRGEVDAALRAG